MTRIAHAVHDEKGGIDGAIPGDQGRNGNEEVCIAQYYAKNDAGKPWAQVLRARDSTVAERVAANTTTVLVVLVALVVQV